MAKKTNEIWPRLSRIDFFRYHGSDFFEALVDCIEVELGKGVQRARLWARLNAYQQGVHSWLCFDGEVRNGGLTQFFYNHTDILVPALEALLKAAGCMPMAELLEQATALYQKHKKAFAVEDPFGSGLFESMTELAKLDRTFLRRVEGTSKRLEKWVRAHIAQIAIGDEREPIDPKFSGTIESYHQGGVVFEQAVVERGVLNGSYYRYSEDGVLEISHFYEAGEDSAVLWARGLPKRKKSKRGKLTVHEWYFPSGQLQKQFVADRSGKAVEPIRVWYENGQLAEELHVNDGEKCGPWLKFFDDGSPHLEAVYPKRARPVIKNAWDEERRQVVKDGHGTYFDDGRDIEDSQRLFYPGHWTSSIELRGGVPHGVETTWNFGVLWTTDEFVNGTRHGVCTHYYDNGRPQTKTTYRGGKEVKTEKLPKFDDPRPAVLLEVTTEEEMHRIHGQTLLDAYPTPLNLDEVRNKLEIPAFLEAIFERNKAGALENDYEDLNSFHVGLGYSAMVNVRGLVDKTDCHALDPYCLDLIDHYAAVIRRLAFEPGRSKGRKVRCQVNIVVNHTFVEAASARMLP